MFDSHIEQSMFLLTGISETLYTMPLDEEVNSFDKGHE